MSKEKEENKQSGPIPAKQVLYTYALLQETSADDGESHYVFIRYQGNENNLKHLAKQLSLVNDWNIDYGSVFDLELDYLVSETTAKEMTKVDINSYFHRKFNGRLKKVSLGLKDNESDRKKIRKITKILGDGGISEFLEDEDLDPDELEELMNQSSSSDEEEDEDDEDDEEEDKNDDSAPESDDEDSASENEKNEKNEKKEDGKLPGSKIEIPRYAKIKQRKNKK